MRTVSILSVDLFTIHKVVLMGRRHHVSWQNVSSLASVVPSNSCQWSGLILVEAHGERSSVGSLHVPNVVRVIIHIENFLLLSS